MALNSEKALKSNFNKPNIVHCKYCGKECKNLNSLKQHECRCKNNPDRINVINKNFNAKGKVAWNKGLTKETDVRVLNGCKTFAENQLNGVHINYGHLHTQAEKEHLRECAIKNGLGGFKWRRGIFYNGIKLDSSYEVMLVENLDENGIKWERCGKFSYHIDNKLHYYTPDFYLPDYDVYLDPKNDFLIDNINPNLGYKDTDKIRQVEIENNIKVLILNKNQLSWNNIKTLL